MRRFLRDNGLSLVMFGCFAGFFIGEIFTGFADYNGDRQAHGLTEVGMRQYLTSGHFLEGLFENWESEFLQMGAYVALTVFLFQKGSAESKDPDQVEDVDEDPRKHRKSTKAPWPVRRGGWMLKVYEHSLSLTLFILFGLSFIGHAVGGCRHYNEERMLHGQAPVTCAQYLASSRFWFESFQNWQSEFLAVFCIVFLSVWLREKGSPESKPVAAPHR